MRKSPILLTASLLILLVCLAPARAQNATFTGRVTDQNTGAAISGVAVVAIGNQTGTRVAVTDAQGNYSVSLGPGANTDVFLRAYKTNYVFNPLSSEFLALGGFPLTGTFTRNLTGTLFPFPILIFALPPILLTEDNSLNALAIDAANQIRDPFALTNNQYFGPDKRARVTLFLVDMDLYSGETLSIVTAQAVDPQLRSYALTVEDLRKVPNVPWMSQLTVRLPAELAGVSNITISISARGQVSNAGKVRLKT